MTGRTVSGRPRTKLSSNVQTRRAHSLTMFGGAFSFEESLKSTSRPSHQHLRCIEGQTTSITESRKGLTAGLRQKSNSFCAVIICW